MSAVLHRLANGLTVAVDPLPGAESVALGLYASVGSRCEPERVSGLAHLVEHMVFKGAGGRDARALAEAIEDVGGHLNAWTARDQTAFHGRCLPQDAPLLCGLIADLIRAPHLHEEHIEREKHVILSEIGEAADAPDDVVHDHLFEAAYGRQPLGRPVLGTEACIRSITRDDCANWISAEFAPSRLVLSASGKVDPQAVLRTAEALFGDMAARDPAPVAAARFEGGARHDDRKSEQAHWCLAFEGLAATDPHMPALSLFVQALGGGSSSRLFQELREERGLAYSIGCWSQAFADTGLVTIGCAADRSRAAESIALARDVLKQAVDGLDDSELRRARAQIEAGLLMALESPQGRADHMARSIELFGRILPTSELIGELRAVDAAGARQAGAALLEHPAAFASVGARLAAAA